MLAQPTWQGIPVNIRTDIVQFLDYKSRFCLRICSKTDMALVDNSPIHIHRIVFHVMGTANSHSDSLLIITNQEETVNIPNNTVDHFVNVFKQKRSIVDEVLIVCKVFNGHGQANFPLFQLIDELKSLGPDLKIRAKEIDLSIKGIPDQYNIDILQLFDPAVINSIILSREISRATLKKMVECDVWKNAKRTNFRVFQNLSIDEVLHFNNMLASLMRISPQDVENLIKKFTSQKDIRRGYGFQMRFLNLDIRGISSVKLPILEMTRRRQPRVHTQHFKTTNKEIVFILSIGAQRIKGFACSVNNPDEDFKSFSVSSQSKEFEPKRCPYRNQRFPPQPVIETRDYFEYGPYLTDPINVTEHPVAHRFPQPDTEPIQVNPDASLYIPL